MLQPLARPRAVVVLDQLAHPLQVPTTEDGRVIEPPAARVWTLSIYQPPVFALGRCSSLSAFPSVASDASSGRC